MSLFHNNDRKRELESSRFFSGLRTKHSEFIYTENKDWFFPLIQHEERWEEGMLMPRDVVSNAGMSPAFQWHLLTTLVYSSPLVPAADASTYIPFRLCIYIACTTKLHF